MAPENNNNKKQKQFFRVAIFGSARTEKTDPTYINTFDLACDIGKESIDIVTGGGPGIMEAANSGHKCGSTDKIKSIGLLIKLPWENEGNRHLDIKKNYNKFSTRLDSFMKLSNVVVVMPGGIGTILELFYTWQLVQVQHVKNLPIILHGTMWNHLISWVKKDVLNGEYINKEDLDFIYAVKNKKEAMEIISHFHKIYKDTKGTGILKYNKYKIETSEQTLNS